jgi:hypothetical protein
MKNSAMVILIVAMGCGVEHAPSGAQNAGGGKADEGAQGGSVQTLICSSSEFQQFQATLDGSNYTAGSGYVDARAARIVDNFATASLICTGHRPEDIDCIGFFFDIASEVGEVTTTNGATGLTASWVALRGNAVHGGGPWPCTMQ